MEENGEVVLTFITGYKKFKSQFCGLKKNRKSIENGFRFNGKIKYTRKIDLNLPNINLCSFFKFAHAYTV